MTILEQEALALDPHGRARLARMLLDSLEPPGFETEADELAEIERRAQRLETEGSRGASWSEVRAEIERGLAR
jgi:putative addiction module component (TIGR02574 family)